MFVKGCRLMCFKMKPSRQGSTGTLFEGLIRLLCPGLEAENLLQV